MQIMLVVSISWLYHCNIHYKDVVKHSNMGHKFIYVFLSLSPCFLIQKCLLVTNIGLALEDLASASWFWPRPQPRSFGLSLGLGVLTSFNITESQTLSTRVLYCGTAVKCTTDSTDRYNTVISATLILQCNPWLYLMFDVSVVLLLLYH